MLYDHQLSHNINILPIRLSQKVESNKVHWDKWTTVIQTKNIISKKVKNHTNNVIELCWLAHSLWGFGAIHSKFGF